MDYCVGIAGFLSKGVAEYAQAARRVGVRKVEVLYGLDKDTSPQLSMELDKHELLKVKETFKQSGVHPYALVVPNDFTSSAWEKHLNMAKNAVDAAVILETSIIVMYGGTFPSFDPSKDDWNYRRMPAISNELFERSTSCFKKLMDYADDCSVQFAIENHDNMTFSGEQFTKFLDDINSDKLGVAFDATNFRCLGENPFLAYDLLKDKIFHVHLKGAHQVEDRVVFDRFMDKDDFDWEGMLRLLKISYQGVYVLECLFPEVAEESIVRNLAFFNEVMEKV